MKIQPTPGPWRVRLSPQYLNATIYGRRGQHVAEVWSGNARDMKAVEANAKILSAALKMREALALCYGALTEEGTTDRQRKNAIRGAAAILDRTA